MLSSRPPAAHETQVVLIRHGQSTYNAAGLVQGASNVPELTPKGFASASSAGTYLSDFGISVILSSPLRRAAQTAAQIALALARNNSLVPVYFDDLLKEVHLPLWEGLTQEEVIGTYGTAYSVWRSQPHLFRMGDEHSPVADLFEAATSFWRNRVPHLIGRRILVVAHSGSCRALLCTALGMSPEYFHSLQSSNLGISLLNFTDGRLESGRLAALNLTGHLGEHLPKLKEGRRGLRLLLYPEAANTADLGNLIDATQPDVLVSAGLNVDYTLAERIRRFRPEVPVDFWPARKLLSVPPCDIPDGRLFNLLVLAQSWEVKHLLLRLLGLPPAAFHRLEINTPRLTAIHYSSQDVRPILQVMNACGVAQSNSVVDEVLAC